MSIVNNQGIPLSSVGLKVPFSIIVTVHDADSVRAWPTVEGLHAFHVIGQRSDMHMVASSSPPGQQSQAQKERTSTANNAHTAERRFLYSVTADTPGTYSIGPARVPGEPGESERVTITVLDAQTPKKEKFAQPTYQFILSKEKGSAG